MASFNQKDQRVSTQYNADNITVQGKETDPTQWEYCSIFFEKNVGELSIRFRAEAHGPKGVYTAGTSRRFYINVVIAVFAGLTFDTLVKVEPDRNEPSHINALNDLIKNLISNGWERTGERGSYWWAHKFRRKVSS